ncbi:DNA polymerase III subunit delta [soil metagenome]
MTFEKIIQDLKKRIFHPVYFLCGDEPYYIDLISDYIEKNVLSDGEKEFNQTVLYGKEVDVPTLISFAKRYPMMSSHQVVIVKEAQDIKNLISKESKEDKNFLLDYVMQPQKATILVFCYKYKSLDKRTKTGKELEKHALVFESKKLYDNKVPEWISDYVVKQGHRINSRAAALMAEYLGTDLSKIANELEKLFLNVTPGAEIDLALVENNIGISKEFNIFELHGALGRRNILKANQIVNYFGANQKTNPLQLTIPQLHSYFMKILTYHRLPVKGRNEVAGALGVNPYFVGDYEAAAKVYPEEKVINVISLLRDYDMRSKGVNAPAMSEGSLLKELIYKILH